MKVLVIGAGGREHVLAHKLNQSPLVDEVHAIPGSDAMAQVAEVHTDIAESAHDDIVDFAQQQGIEWVVVGPEQPLTEGLADRLLDVDIKVFGPTQAAAQIEGSKSFAKKLMAKYDIPTADYREISSKKEAQAYIQSCDYPVVLKKDGLAAGKGVIIADNYDEAAEAVEKLYPTNDETVVLRLSLKVKNSRS